MKLEFKAIEQIFNHGVNTCFRKGLESAGDGGLRSSTVAVATFPPIPLTCSHLSFTLFSPPKSHASFKNVLLYYCCFFVVVVSLIVEVGCAEKAYAGLCASQKLRGVYLQVYT